jgi:hypothetical protein
MTKPDIDIDRRRGSVPIGLAAMTTTSREVPGTDGGKS